jgi:hypothetical protein
MFAAAVAISEAVGGKTDPLSLAELVSAAPAAHPVIFDGDVCGDVHAVQRADPQDRIR